MLFLATICTLNAQKQPHFTEIDSLRGRLTEERTWWDLQHYDLSFKVDVDNQSIKGENIITYKVIKPNRRLQIELQAPMKITKATYEGQPLQVAQKGMIHYITLPALQKKNSIQKIKLNFEGKPTISKNPPWEAGFTWSKDENGHDFIATTCQGEGASVWWPTKEIGYDEPDKGVDIHIDIDEKSKVAVSNGRLISEKKQHGRKHYDWRVTQPINNYSINLNIGNYVHFGETFQGEKGALSCDYYVLKQHLPKAKKQFKEAKRTLQAFEHWFGSYPFYEDGYKLVEVPYLGMEHQSSVTYGNGYQNGYRGRDLSHSGVGLKFDFIIVHESGHEWFGNNISHKDIADMWIHESFTAYSETLFVEYHFGKEDAGKYVRGTRKNILNDRPIIGIYGVNYEGSGDMYYKGANMLHTIRQVIDDTEKFRSILRGLNRDFYHQTVTSKMVEDYISKHSGIDFSKVFDQYLRDVRVPLLVYKVNGNKMLYKWTRVVDGFDMPVKVHIDGKTHWLKPTKDWRIFTATKPIKKVAVNVDFYVEARRL